MKIQNQDLENSRFACFLATTAVCASAVGLGAWGIYTCLESKSVSCALISAVAMSVICIPSAVLIGRFYMLKMRPIKPQEAKPIALTPPTNYQTF